jgi:hypothetical protein
MFVALWADVFSVATKAIPTQRRRYRRSPTGKAVSDPDAAATRHDQAATLQWQRRYPTC